MRRCESCYDSLVRESGLNTDRLVILVKQPRSVLQRWQQIEQRLKTISLNISAIENLKSLYSKALTILSSALKEITELHRKGESNQNQLQVSNIVFIVISWNLKEKNYLIIV